MPPAGAPVNLCPYSGRARGAKNVMNEKGESRWSAKLKAFAIFGSAFVTATGLAGLTGWVLDIPRLRTVLPGLVAMKANTAACLIFIGTALWLRRACAERSPIQTSVARVLALIVAVVGILSFAECVRGWNLGIDQLLFVENVADAAVTGRPGLMS